MKKFAQVTLAIVAVLVCSHAHSQVYTTTAQLAADTFPGADASIRINACEKVQSVLGGTCDARMFTGNQIMSQQVNVLSNTVLLLPQAAVWVWDLRDGVSAGLMQFTNSSIVGSATGGGGNQMTLLPGSNATRMIALYATDGNPNYGSYIYASGFSAANSFPGATFSHGVVYTRLLFDESRIERVVASNAFGDAWHILSACCDSEFIQVQASSNYGPNGGTPLTVEDAIGQPFGSAFAWSGTVNWAGDGHPNIDIQDNNYTIDFPEMYVEANGHSDETTPVLQVETTNHYTPVVRLRGGGSNVGRKPCFSFPNGFQPYNFENDNWCGPNTSSNQTLVAPAINQATITGGTAAGLASVKSGWFGYNIATVQEPWDHTLPQNGQVGAGNTLFTPTAVGWYRVFSGAFLQGSFDIRTSDPEQDIVGMVQQGWYNSPANITILNTGESLGANHVVTQVATSASGGAFGEYLDIYVADVSNPLPISVTFTGQGVTNDGVVAAPVLGSGPAAYGLAKVDLQQTDDSNFPAILSSGGIGAAKFTGTLATPRSSNDYCRTGQFWDDANFHYVCVATNSIRRVALSSF